MYLLAPFILENLGKLLRVDRELSVSTQAQNSPFDLNKIFGYKSLLLLRACTLPKTWGKGGGGKNFTKVFAGGTGGSEIFTLEWGFILLGEG